MTLFGFTRASFRSPVTGAVMVTATMVLALIVPSAIRGDGEINYGMKCVGSQVSCSNCATNPTTNQGTSYGCSNGALAGMSFQYGACGSGAKSDSCTEQLQTCGTVTKCSNNLSTGSTCTNMTICSAGYIATASQ